VVDVAVMAVCGCGFAAMLLCFTMLLLTNNHPGGRDFVSYWTAGHQIMNHANPYDSAAILQAERAVGFPATGQSLIMRNAPWSLPLVMPLGALGLNVGALCWSALLAACMALSVYLTWELLGKPKDKLHLLGYMFGPGLICVLTGQTALIALVGLVLFLRLHLSRPFLAGMALWLCALKPHLFLPFGVTLLLWIVAERAWRLLAGFAVMMAVSSLLATWFDPAIWMQYREMMRTAGIEGEFIPCLSVALRFAIHRQAMWIEYLPAAAACVWAVYYFRGHRERWSWTEHGALLMLVGVALAPYAWIMDQALLIPAVMLGIYRCRSRAQLEVMALGGAVMEFTMSFSVGAHSAFYLWTGTFWMGWFVWVRRGVAGEERTGSVVGKGRALAVVRAASGFFHSGRKGAACAQNDDSIGLAG
jgi:hypothetical protein